MVRTPASEAAEYYIVATTARADPTRVTVAVLTPLMARLAVTSGTTERLVHITYLMIMDLHCRDSHFKRDITAALKVYI